MLAGAGFALFFVAIAQPDASSGGWPLVTLEFTALVMLVALAFIRRPAGRLWDARGAWLAGALGLSLLMSLLFAGWLMQKLIDWEALGYEIAGTANDGLRALELVREKQPHLLITDVRMPGCDGIELIQRAKAMVPLLVPLFISAFRRATDLAMAMEARCYRGGEGRTKMKPLKYRGADRAAYALFFVYLAVLTVIRLAV